MHEYIYYIKIYNFVCFLIDSFNIYQYIEWVEWHDLEKAKLETISD